MRKLRSDSCWKDLSPEQWETLEGWLLDENISYREAQERLSSEWGLTRSLSSLVRLRKYCAKTRAINGMRETMKAAEKVNESGANLEALRDSVRRVLSRRYFEQAASGENLKELAVVGRLLSESENREIRRERLAFARERWQFRVTKEAMKALPMLDEWKKQAEEMEEKRMEELRIKLFGKKLCDSIIQ
ncbi:MAG TPA: hypothetical protein VFB72_07315 [Verrucomicrobiae bacterium]|nr:hypothetical protein [Verrucomicrobiae bacterium]